MQGIRIGRTSDSLAVEGEIDLAVADQLDTAVREALDDGAVGLWHETYLASPGSWEGVYLNLPPWGLAAGVEAVEMQATKGSARERLREQRKRASRAAAEKPPP